MILSGGSSKLLIPPVKQYLSGSFTTDVTLNATGESVHCTGRIYLENPLSGSKTISSAGGGSIVWLAGTSTIAAGSNFKVGIQDTSTATAPAQGDGTFDVEASFTTTGITTGAVNTSVMTTGTKTIAHGDMVTIAFQLTSRTAPDAVIVRNCHVGTEAVGHVYGAGVTENTGGTYAYSAAIPNTFIIFDDGTVGYFYPAEFIATSSTTAINSTTGTADEYGNAIKLPYVFMAEGIQANITFAGTSSDCELILYSDPLGTPVAEKTVVVDATQASQTGNARHVTGLFPAAFKMKANTQYAISVRPTTANNVTLIYDDGNVASQVFQPPNNYAYGIRRLDNTGAFADTNGGTAKTRLYRVSVFGYWMEQGVNNANYRIGI